MDLRFSEERLSEFEKIAHRYPDRRAALLPALWMAQKEFGYLSHDAMRYVAELVGTSPAKVLEVAEFYTMFQLKKPGRYHLQVCGTLSCWLAGAEEIARIVEETLHLKHGEATPDGLFSYEHVECLGSCHTAPVMQVNDDYHENLTVESVRELIENLQHESEGVR